MIFTSFAQTYTMPSEELLHEGTWLQWPHQYEYGVWVNYNTNPQIPGNGSCIFLHIYKTPTTPTSGCTAMSKENMLKLIHWLNASKNPMLIQYPIHR